MNAINKNRVNSVANLLIKKVEVAGLKDDDQIEEGEDFEKGDLETIIHIDDSDNPAVSIVFHNKKYGRKGKNAEFLLALNREQAILLGQHLLLATHVKEPE